MMKKSMVDFLCEFSGKESYGSVCYLLFLLEFYL